MRRFHAKRKRAKKHFGGLMKLYGARCRYCRCEVIPVSFIPIEDRIKETPHWITARIDGTEMTIRKATIDHAVKLADGGSNYYANLVLSCVACNQNKDKMPKTERNKRCRRCGQLKRGIQKNRRYCIVCYQEMVHEYYLLAGVGLA